MSIFGGNQWPGPDGGVMPGARPSDLGSRQGHVDPRLGDDGAKLKPPGRRRYLVAAVATLAVAAVVFGGPVIDALSSR